MHAQACSRALAVSTAMCFPCDLDLAWRSFRVGAQACIPQGSGPAVDEAQRRLQVLGFAKGSVSGGRDEHRLISAFT